MSWISEQVYRYYIDPIIYDSGYNPVNTITWAIVLGIMILLLIRLFKRLDIKMDEEMVANTIPYVLAGASLRVIEDADLLRPPASYLLITPLIYFLVFLVTISALVLSRNFLGKSFYSGYAAFGFFWTLINLIALSSAGFQRLWVIGAVLILGSAATGAVLAVRQFVPQLGFLDNRLNLAVLYAHMLDASSTYIGVDWFGYYEKHVVPTFIIDRVGTAAVMYPLKLLVLLPVLAIVDQALEDPSLRNLTKLTLITLGLAPAVRNTLRLALGV